MHNDAEYVRQCIDSVLAQTYTNWEMIIVDDCSTDDSYEIVAEQSKLDNRIKLFKLPRNGGTAAARNEGIRQANGRFVVFLDSDDLLDASFLEEQTAFICNKKCAIATSGYRRKARETTTPFFPPDTTTFDSILNGNPVSCLTTIQDIKITGKHFFDETLLKCEDFYYWIVLLKEGFGPIVGNPKALATYRILEQSKSRKKAALIKWMLIVYKKAGVTFFARFYHLFRWMVYGLKKYRDVK